MIKIVRATGPGDRSDTRKLMLNRCLQRKGNYR